MINIKQILLSHFRIKDPWCSGIFLGMKVVDVEGYLCDAIFEYGLLGSKPVSTLVDSFQNVVCYLILPTLQSQTSSLVVVQSISPTPTDAFATQQFSVHLFLETTQVHSPSGYYYLYTILTSTMCKLQVAVDYISPQRPSCLLFLINTTKAVFHGTKHLDIDCHIVHQGLMRLLRVSSSNQLARDIRKTNHTDIQLAKTRIEVTEGSRTVIICSFFN